MNIFSTKQANNKLQLLGIATIVVFMFVQSTFGCKVESVTLFVGTTETEAQGVNIESVTVSNIDAAFVRLDTSQPPIF